MAGAIDRFHIQPRLDETFWQANDHDDQTRLKLSAFHRMRIKEILNLTITFARREEKSQHRGELSSMFVNNLLTLSAFGFVRVF
jgi:hypothetical protein